MFGVAWRMMLVKGLRVDQVLVELFNNFIKIYFSGCNFIEKMSKTLQNNGLIELQDWHSHKTMQNEECHQTKICKHRNSSTCSPIIVGKVDKDSILANYPKHIFDKRGINFGVIRSCPKGYRGSL